MIVVFIILGVVVVFCIVSLILRFRRNEELESGGSWGDQLTKDD